MFDFQHFPLLSLMTAYDQCTSEAEKEKLLSCIRYGRLKRFVDKSQDPDAARIETVKPQLIQIFLSSQKLGPSTKQNSVSAVLYSRGFVVEK